MPINASLYNLQTILQIILTTNNLANNYQLSRHWMSDMDELLHSHAMHDDVIKWKHFPRNWPFVRGIHRSTMNSPHKGQWRGALMFSVICVWINGWVNNREAGDMRRYRAHYDVNVMITHSYCHCNCGLAKQPLKLGQKWLIISHRNKE